MHLLARVVTSICVDVAQGKDYDIIYVILTKADLSPDGVKAVGWCTTIVEGDIEAGGTGRIELRGTTWSAHNVGERVLPQNARVRVDAVSGLTVEVRSADS